MFSGVHTPEMPSMATEFDRLYLEKCQEVNKLTLEVEKYKSMVEIAVKQKGEIRQQLEEAKQTIRELAAEPLKGFMPDVEPPEELPEELMEELPLWALQPVTSQDILCLSSALKNLHEIHKCDSFVLYAQLSRVLEQKIKEYCGED